MISVVSRLAAALGIGMCLLCESAFADNRIALVIGNSSYRSIPALPNPANDAQAIGVLLTNAGFQVISTSDLGQSEMRRAIRDFTAKVGEQGPDTVALVFYAGHGLQIDGENYLVPVDARIRREADVAIEALRLGDLMNALAAVPAKMRIVILDACRNNPFTDLKQTGGKGLAIVDAPTGSIVAYSTAPGTEATDGAGGNSPYTAALVEVAREPHMPIEQVFKRVRLKVHQATSGNQTPWESSSLTGDFWFLPIGGEPAPAAAPAVAAAPEAAAPASGAVTRTPAGATPAPAAGPSAPVAATPAPSHATPAPVASAAVARERRHAARLADVRALPPSRAYEVAVEEDSVEFYEEFVLAYPTDPLAEIVRLMLARRVDALAWRQATVTNTPAAYAAYATSYPGGDYAEQAVRLQVRPRMRQIDSVFVPRVIAPPPPVRVALPIVQPRPPVRIMPGVPVNAPPTPPPAVRLPQPPLASPGAMPPGTPGVRPGGLPPAAALPPLPPGSRLPGARPGGLPPAASLPPPGGGAKPPGPKPPPAAALPPGTKPPVLPPGARPGVPPAATLPPPSGGAKPPPPQTVRPPSPPAVGVRPPVPPQVVRPVLPPPQTVRPAPPPPVAVRAPLTPPPAVRPAPPPRPVAVRPPPPPPSARPAVPPPAAAKPKCPIVNGREVCPR